MIIGERVKQARIEKGYTQGELGKIIGVSKVSVCGYETGNRTPTIDVLIKLIETLDISSDYLIGNDIRVVSEEEEPYQMMIAKEDLKILQAIKNNQALYNQLYKDPERTIKLINRKLK
ncbi:MAG: helix-turn-helix transcriptional regulator [Bacilli bacterium]|nr:helix-turn-helix transcriptional regulator [Bacilli bacterium]